MRKFALAALVAAASLSPLAAQTARMFSYDGIAVEADAGAAADVSWMSFVAAEDLTTTPAALLGCSVGAGASLRILQGLYLRESWTRACAAAATRTSEWTTIPCISICP